MFLECLILEMIALKCCADMKVVQLLQETINNSFS